MGYRIILGVCAVAALILFVYYQETHLPPEEGSDAILVLGAQVKEDGTPSVALERRMTVAMEAFQENNRILIACGAQGANEPAPEGQVMKAWMMEHGIPEEWIVEETASSNTRQNLLNAKGIMKDKGLHKALIVTSDYHVPRALAIAEQIGLEASGRGSPSKPEYFLKNHLREGMSWIKFWLESMRR